MMLVELKNAKSEIYASSLAKSVDCTYSHVVKILQEMEKAGFEMAYFSVKTYGHAVGIAT